MATLRLAPLFQNHAVLQNGQLIPVWGWATPKAKVSARIGDETAFAYANENGAFSLTLPAMEVGGPYVLSVQDHETEELIEVEDILIGEVWLASGQSNMEWSMRACGETVAADVGKAEFPKIRFFKVEESAALGHHDEVEGSWKLVSPDSVLDCSAVAFSFGRALQRELDVPVGLVVSARGGTIIESWTSRSGLVKNPQTTDYCLSYEQACHSPSRWAKGSEVGEAYNRFPADPGNLALDRGWAGPEFDDSDWQTMELPNTWQSQGQDYSGVFWFRKRIEIPESWVGQDLSLSLGAIDKQDVTYVNGVEVGRVGEGFEMQHWTENRRYTVPASLVTSREVLVAVRVYSFAYDGGMRGPRAWMTVQPEKAEGEPILLDGEWKYAVEHDFGLVATVSDPGHNEPNSPHMLFDNMILPLAPYAVKGAIWYQGESNAHQRYEYAGRLKALVEDWRYLWAQKSFPFYVVQLPDYLGVEPYQDNSTWAGLRQAQLKVLDLPETGIAITLGLGEADDIHPTDKMPVGERLAQCALVQDYGREGEPCGPLLIKSSLSSYEVICEFSNVGEGMGTTDGKEPLGVFIAGKDKQFLPAVARLQGMQLVCSHPDIEEPAAVRYAWADNPAEYNLCNSGGQLASPFRTDDWD